jgi:phosphoadenosine phosphosulfate reductase
MIDFSPLDRHERTALSFSGGKDSLACLYLLRPHLDRITVYHHDTGDLMPETRAIVSQVKGMCPNFVHIKGNIRSWIDENGLPTDLLPYSMHGLGVAVGQSGAKLVTRYQCCFINLMWPIWARIKEDGNTLCIRGTKLADQAKLPAYDGETHDNIEMWFPINTWSHEDVQKYLASVRAPRNPLYDHMTNSPECARCTAWWDERRGAYLRTNHPSLFAEYARDLKIVAREVAKPINALRRELAEVI